MFFLSSVLAAVFSSVLSLVHLSDSTPAFFFCFWSVPRRFFDSCNVYVIPSFFNLYALPGGRQHSFNFLLQQQRCFYKQAGTAALFLLLLLHLFIAYAEVEKRRGRMLRMMLSNASFSTSIPDLRARISLLVTLGIFLVSLLLQKMLDFGVLSWSSPTPNFYTTFLLDVL